MDDWRLGSEVHLMLQFISQSHGERPERGHGRIDVFRYVVSIVLIVLDLKRDFGSKVKRNSDSTSV